MQNNTEVPPYRLWLGNGSRKKILQNEMRQKMAENKKSQKPRKWNRQKVWLGQKRKGTFSKWTIFFVFVRTNDNCNYCAPVGVGFMEHLAERELLGRKVKAQEFQAERKDRIVKFCITRWNWIMEAQFGGNEEIYRMENTRLKGAM